MAEILFVDCCMRERGVSRTGQLADAFLEAYRSIRQEDRIDTVTLPKEPIRCLLAEDIDRRDQLIRSKALDDPMFGLAWQFARADKILIAAPFWDLSIPALLKAYIENICVCGITFHYTDSGQEGLCRAKKLAFLTTRGGEFSEGFTEPYEMGARYLNAMCALWGIPEFQAVAAEGLDIIGKDVNALMNDALERTRALAQNW